MVAGPRSPAALAAEHCFSSNARKRVSAFALNAPLPKISRPPGSARASVHLQCRAKSASDPADTNRDGAVYALTHFASQATESDTATAAESNA